MAYTLSVGIALGSSQTGLTLSAQLVDTSGVNVGSAVSSGFVELGGGDYLWTYDGFPEGFRGAVKFSAGGTFKAAAEINPEDATPEAAPGTVFVPSAQAPTVDEIGALIRTRTKASLASGGAELGTFDTTTRPTGEEVEGMIGRVSASLGVRLGQDLPEIVWPAVKEVVALKVAMWVERSREPEQIGNPGSAYSELKDEYEEAWDALRESIREVGSGEDPGEIDDMGVPSGWFPVEDPCIGGVEPIGWATSF